MAAMFNGNFLEANSILVPVYGVSKDTFLSFLEYLYTDSCCPGEKILNIYIILCWVIKNQGIEGDYCALMHNALLCIKKHQ